MTDPDRKYRVLLIDDDETLLTFLGEFLRDRGYIVETAMRGTGGLRTMYDTQPDIILLDVMMPGMDGWVTASRIREISSTPIIFLTAKTREQDKLRGFRLGVDDYVTKPFSFAELAARINAVLTRTQAASPAERDTPLLVGDLSIDLARQLITRGGKTISLSPTEFKLLRFLVESRDRAVSEAEILKAVWALDESDDNSYVRRYIWFLRQKLEVEPGDPVIIQTVRGFGYRFVVEE